MNTLNIVYKCLHDCVEYISYLHIYQMITVVYNIDDLSFYRFYIPSKKRFTFIYIFMIQIFGCFNEIK